MERWEGHTVIKETATEIVQQKKYIFEKGASGIVISHGNPHPDLAEQTKGYERIYEVLEKNRRERQAAEAIKKEKAEEGNAV